jgi:putative colanic acid biosynthesis acetyltransferase WcaF
MLQVMFPLKTFNQATPYDSPWTRGEQVRMLLWEYAWLFLCAWTPKPFNPWRLLIFRSFGGCAHGSPFIHQRARIQIPWNLTLHDRACLGDRANAYSLGPIEIGARATVAQEAYLCAGTHDFTQAAMPLQTGAISIGEDVFVGARAFVLPGVRIGAGCVIGAAAVVTRDIPAGVIAAGNPCRVLRPLASGPA